MKIAPGGGLVCLDPASGKTICTGAIPKSRTGCWKG